MNISKNKNNCCAIIPFYNEKNTLKKIISETSKFVDSIIIVNDGSTDSWNTEIPENGNIFLISHEKNLGKGEALKTGFIKSIEQNNFYTIALDADLQHDPKYIPNLLNGLIKFDMVIGKRNILKSEMPFHRRMSNYLTSKLLSIKTGKNILDSQSGFRGFKTEILKEILPTFSGFEAESEMIVKCCKKNYTIGYFEIPTIYGNDDSKMKAIPTILGFLKVLFKS